MKGQAMTDALSKLEIDKAWHCYPVDDLREHILTGTGCWCRPTEDNGTVLHNSMDRREEYENGRKPS